jgi:hypothetical protein
MMVLWVLLLCLRRRLNSHPLKGVDTLLMPCECNGLFHLATQAVHLRTLHESSCTQEHQQPGSNKLQHFFLVNQSQDSAYL